MPEKKSSVLNTSIRRKPNHTRRRVHFGATAYCYSVPSLDDMSMEELCARWGSDEDDQAMKKDFVGALHCVRLGKKEDDDFTSRGLEPVRDAAHMELLKRSKKLVILSVLKEQSKQRVLGITNEDAIAETSTKASSRARDRAIEFASSDEAYVRRFVKRRPATEHNPKNSATSDDALYAVLGEALKISEAETPTATTPSRRPRRKRSKSSRNSQDLRTAFSSLSDSNSHKFLSYQGVAGQHVQASTN